MVGALWPRCGAHAPIFGGHSSGSTRPQRHAPAPGDRGTGGKGWPTMKFFIFETWNNKICMRCFKVKDKWDHVKTPAKKKQKKCMT